MKDKHRTKFVTKDIFKSSVIGAFTKLNPKYMMHNPVMFVVEIGFVIALLLSIFPELFGPTDGINNVRLYNIFVCVILFVTVLFANFAEAVAEGRGKAPGREPEEDPEGHQGPSAQGRRHRDRRLLQRAEEGRRGHGQRR